MPSFHLKPNFAHPIVPHSRSLHIYAISQVPRVRKFFVFNIDLFTSKSAVGGETAKFNENHTTTYTGVGV